MPRRNGASRMMFEQGSRVAENARDYLDQGRHALHRFDEQMEETVRGRPHTSVLAALGIGVAIGILMTLACPASFPQLKGR
jgi:ElaB/YqjD/DUF883 family membrane-anchored ribosome-binding protein